MIVDFKKPQTPDAFAADVCIVGAGAAGIPLALELARAGVTVAVVESGAVTPESVDQKLNRGEVADGARFSGLEDGRSRSLGGATKLWYGQCIRLDPLDFEPRPWLRASGWPITLGELTPYYERAEAFFGILGEPYDASVFARFGMPEPQFDPAYCRPHFTIYSPHVDLGSIHHAALAQDAKITLILHANVVEITTDPAGTEATGVRIRTLDGRAGSVSARSVVLCGGGIENARLLLLSDAAKPAGLGNERGLVGRYFQDHPNAQTATLFTNAPKRAAEFFSLFYDKSLRFFPKLALAPQIQSRESLLNCNGHFVFDFPDGSGIAAGKEIYRALRRGKLPERFHLHVRDLVTHLPETIGAAKRFFIDRKSPVGVPSRIRFQCYLEQEPNPDSRVQLSETRDAFGLREARLTWTYEERERRTLVAMTAAIAHEISRLGFGNLAPDAWLTDGAADWRAELRDAFHHMGTTRMGASAADGVVDRDCAVFGVGGLFIAGSSVFPTSGYANPTLTIVALALRLADHLCARKFVS